VRRRFPADCLAARQRDQDDVDHDVDHDDGHDDGHDVDHDDGHDQGPLAEAPTRLRMPERSGATIFSGLAGMQDRNAAAARRRSASKRWRKRQFSPRAGARSIPHPAADGGS
jgi:hypothetical protein